MVFIKISHMKQSFIMQHMVIMDKMKSCIIRCPGLKAPVIGGVKRGGAV
jgi:hypothetical protein